MLTLSEKQRSLYDPWNATDEAFSWRMDQTKAKQKRAENDLHDACANSKFKPHYMADDPNVRRAADAISDAIGEIHFLEYVQRDRR